MDYQQFVSAIEMKVKQCVGAGMSVYTHTTVKNNGIEKVGITVSEQGVNISPTIYLEEYYEQFRKNKSLDSIVKNILELYQKVKVEHSWEAEIMRDFHKIENKIAYKLINEEENRKMFENIPHIVYLDLAVVFYVLLEINNWGMATILITDDILELWGVSVDDVYEKAKKNTELLLPSEFKPMRIVIQELICGIQEEVNKEEEDCMYVLTNDIRCFGAACILYEHVLEDIGNQLGENFYVLPSSIHEVIIVPESNSPNRIELEEMVMEINETQVEEVEVLSDRAYYYIRKEKRLIL